jgi:hypothetical protein
MDLPFCKICGDHHRLGHCPLWDEPPKIENRHATQAAAQVQEADQRHEAEAPTPWQRAWNEARGLSPEDMKQEEMPVTKSRFDRNKYQRDLMRKRYWAKKTASPSSS